MPTREQRSVPAIDDDDRLLPGLFDELARAGDPAARRRLSRRIRATLAAHRAAAAPADTALLDQMLGELQQAEDGADVDVASLTALYHRHLERVFARNDSDGRRDAREPLPRSRSRAGARSDRAPSRLSETTDAVTRSPASLHGLW